MNLCGLFAIGSQPKRLVILKFCWKLFGIGSVFLVDLMFEAFRLERMPN